MKIRTALAAAALVLLAVAGARADLHFALSRSAPEADATVASPKEVRLWFTEVPEQGTVGIRVVAPSGQALETPDAAPDAQDGRQFAVPLAGTLAPGRYSVSWRGVGDDGHAVRGDFAFTVAAE